MLFTACIVLVCVLTTNSRAITGMHYLCILILRIKNSSSKSSTLFHGRGLNPVSKILLPECDPGLVAVHVSKEGYRCELAAVVVQRTGKPPYNPAKLNLLIHNPANLSF